jgi:hypothetical protein
MKEALIPGAVMLYFINGSPVKFGNAEFWAEADRRDKEYAIAVMKCILIAQIWLEKMENSVSRGAINTRHLTSRTTQISNIPWLKY